MDESKLLKELAFFLIFFLNYLVEELSFLHKVSPNNVAIIDAT
jgi:hypothetical protein